MEDWRVVLYPLGFLSSLAFTARFVIQWLASELHGKPTVTGTFWRISIVGNGLLLCHSVLQGQSHVALIQTINGVIACRNLNLLKPSEQRASLRTTAFALIAALAVTVGLFSAFSIAATGTVDWIRVPTAPWNDAAQRSAPFVVHLLGTIGLVLFNCRFWIQWWQAERAGDSVLSPAFWWASLLGAALSLLYFGTIKDPVNLIGPLFGMVPYLRNLMLHYRRPVPGGQP